MVAPLVVGPPLAAHCRVPAPERVVVVQHLAAVESDSYWENRDPGDRTGALAVGPVFHRAATYLCRKFSSLLTPRFAYFLLRDSFTCHLVTFAGRKGQDIVAEK